MLLKNFQRLFSGQSYTSVGWERRAAVPCFEPRGAGHEAAVPRCCLPWRGPGPALGPSLRPHGPRLGQEVGEARAERKVEKTKQGEE